MTGTATWVRSMEQARIFSVNGDYAVWTNDEVSTFNVLKLRGGGPTGFEPMDSYTVDVGQSLLNDDWHVVSLDINVDGVVLMKVIRELQDDSCTSL